MLDFLFAKLRPFVRVLIRWPRAVLPALLLPAVICGVLAMNLRIDNDLARLIPAHYPSVQALETLRSQVGSRTELAVVIESDSFERNLRFAERLIPAAMQLIHPADGSRLFSRVDFHKETDFLESNALYFATDAELGLLESWLDEESRLARMRANPFYFEVEDETQEADSLITQLQEIYEDLIGNEYPVSSDSLTMAVRFYPTGLQTDIDLIRVLYEEMEKLTDALLQTEEDGLRVILAGRLLRSLIEIDTIWRDVAGSFGAGVLMLLTLVSGYFFYKGVQLRRHTVSGIRLVWSETLRIPVTVLVMGLPLVVSLLWTFGVAWIVYGSLNMMTSTLALLLFGMGIDFGIHFYARYLEERREGAPVADAIETTFMTTGKAITAVGITTSAAFFILVPADFKGFSEFGFIAGIGILFSILSMIVLLPSLLVILEWAGLTRGLAPDTGAERHSDDTAGAEGTGSPSGRSTEADVNGRSAIRFAEIISGRKPLSSLFGGAGLRTRFVTAVTVMVVAIAFTFFSARSARHVTFEYDFAKLEPVYDSYVEVAAEARKVYSDQRTRNAAYILTRSPEEAVAVRNALRDRMAADTTSPTIREVETLQDRFPFTETEQIDKLARIGDIRMRLEDRFLIRSESVWLERLRRAAETRSPIGLDEVPEFLLAPFTSLDGRVGNLVIAYPSVALSDGRNSIRFAEDLANIGLPDGTVYTAGSTSIVASDMLRLLIREAPWMVGLTLSFIVIMKLILFRSVTWMLMGLIPLMFSFVWLFGWIQMNAHYLNFYNIVVLPTLLGIGDDSGIHIIHRYLEEGKGSIRKVLRSTGEHITVSALTTMLGFGGLLFSTHPGLRSIGELAIAGIALVLLSSLVLLPALLYLLERFAVAQGRGLTARQEIE